MDNDTKMMDDQDMVDDSEEMAKGMAGMHDAQSQDGSSNPAKLYVGNLAYTVTSEELNELFSQVGRVTDAIVMMDRSRQNWSKGFGFVEMSRIEEAEAAISMFNGKDYKGRPMQVNIARPKTERPQRDYNNNDRGGYRGGGGGRDSGGGGGYRGGGSRGGYRGGGRGGY